MNTHRHKIARAKNVMALSFLVLGFVIGSFVQPVVAKDSTLNPAPVGVPANGAANQSSGSSVTTLQTRLNQSSNPTNSAFKIAVCDGPAGLNTNADGSIKDPNFVPCDFNAAMALVQHLINIMMVVGVLVAIVMFVYAGTLFMSGQKAKIDKARSIFPKIFLGFIIMLSAWFIVYQILSWLTTNSGFKALLK